jgi:hypothetical protein
MRILRGVGRTEGEELEEGWEGIVDRWEERTRRGWLGEGRRRDGVRLRLRLETVRRLGLRLAGRDALK